VQHLYVPSYGWKESYMQRLIGLLSLLCKQDR
jgi:hypothetical protein